MGLEYQWSPRSVWVEKALVHRYIADTATHVENEGWVVTSVKVLDNQRDDNYDEVIIETRQRFCIMIGDSESIPDGIKVIAVYRQVTFGNVHDIASRIGHDVYLLVGDGHELYRDSTINMVLKNLPEDTKLKMDASFKMLWLEDNQVKYLKRIEYPIKGGHKWTG